MAEHLPAAQGSIKVWRTLFHVKQTMNINRGLCHYFPFAAGAGKNRTLGVKSALVTVTCTGR